MNDIKEKQKYLRMHLLPYACLLASFLLFFFFLVLLYFFDKVYTLTAIPRPWSFTVECGDIDIRKYTICSIRNGKAMVFFSFFRPHDQIVRILSTLWLFAG